MEVIEVLGINNILTKPDPDCLVSLLCELHLGYHYEVTAVLVLKGNNSECGQEGREQVLTREMWNEFFPLP